MTLSPAHAMPGLMLRPFRVLEAAAVRHRAWPNMPYLLQGVYHGKPVVAMPMLGDQASNADKVVAKVGACAFASLEVLQ